MSFKVKDAIASVFVIVALMLTLNVAYGSDKLEVMKNAGFIAPMPKHTCGAQRILRMGDDSIRREYLYSGKYSSEEFNVWFQYRVIQTIESGKEPTDQDALNQNLLNTVTAGLGDESSELYLTAQVPMRDCNNIHTKTPGYMAVFTRGQGTKIVTVVTASLGTQSYVFTYVTDSPSEESSTFIETCLENIRLTLIGSAA